MWVDRGIEACHRRQREGGGARGVILGDLIEALGKFETSIQHAVGLGGDHRQVDGDHLVDSVGVVNPSIDDEVGEVRLFDGGDGHGMEVAGWQYLACRGDGSPSTNTRTR